MKEKTIEQIVDDLLKNRKNEELRIFLNSLSIHQLAHCINSLDQGKKKTFRLLEVQKQQDVIREVNTYSLKRILGNLTNPELLELLEGMASDEASDIIHILPFYKKSYLLRKLKKRESEQISHILTYAQHTVGHLMQKELLKIPEDFTIGQAIAKIRHLHRNSKDLHFAFVVDRTNHLKGAVPLEKLIIYPSNTKIQTILEPITAVAVNLDQEEAAHIFKHQDLPALPVINENNQLIGRITADDIVDIVEKEGSEDMYQMAGLSEDEHIFDPPLLSAKKRLFWLTINLATAVFAAMVVALFESTIERVAILAAYIPIVAGMGGNAGTQVVTLMVRSIALKEIEYQDTKRILWKEFIIGILNGVLLGLLIAIVSYWYNQNMMLGVIIAISMVINLIVAGITGTLIPLGLKFFKLDPALASTVFLTTCTDVAGFFVFLSLAQVLL